MKATITLPVRKKVTTGRLDRSKTMPAWVGLPDNWHDILGFVYLIVCKKTGRFYIGKKLFWKAGGKRGKNTVRVESDWKKYWGSSKAVAAEIAVWGVDNFERHVIQCYDSKSELALCELMYQLQHITHPLCLNGIINVRLYIRPEMRNVRSDRDLSSMLDTSRFCYAIDR